MNPLTRMFRNIKRFPRWLYIPPVLLLKFVRTFLMRTEIQDPHDYMHTIFGAVAGQLEARRLHVLPASTYMERYLPGAGVLTGRAPDAREAADIAHGHRAAMTIGAVDIGQTVVVKDGMILAAEAFEGTNAAIRRGARLGGPGAIVVKVARDGHDMRFDIPVVGAATLQVLRRARASALAFQAGRTILLDREAVIDGANRRGIAVVAIDSGLPPAPTRPPAESPAP